MITLMFYPKDKPYINKIKLKEELTKLKIVRTEATINRNDCIAITIDEKQWDNLSDDAKEMITFIFEFNWDFSD